MKRMQVLLALTAGTSLLATQQIEAQTRPAPGTPTIQPVKPGGPQIQPPRPVKPTPVRPRPPIQPPRPVKPKPPRPPHPVRPIPVRPRPPITVNPGWNFHHPGWAYGRAVLFSDSYYRGHYMTIHHNVPNLRNYGFNNRAESMHARGRWLVCTKANYRGRCHTIRGSDPHLGRLGDKISSLRYLGH
jgi:hypothetical protein